MRVTIATMQYGPGYAQGTERYVRTLVRGLARLGHEPTVLAGDPESRRSNLDSFAEVDDPDCRVVHCPTNGWLAISGDASIPAWLEAKGADVLHVANPAHIGIGVLEAAQRLGVASVVTTMDLWWVWPVATGPSDLDWTHEDIALAGDKDWLKQAAGGRNALAGLLPGAVLLRAVLSRQAERGFDEWQGGDRLTHWRSRRGRIGAALGGAGAVVFPSPGTRDLVEPLRAGSANRGNDVSMGYGLEESWFQDRSAPGEPRLFYAGALTPHKGLDVLLEALTLCETKPRLTVAGAWPDDAKRFRERCERLAQGSRVTWAGRLGEEQIREQLAGSTAAVLPSRWRENLPFSVLEAHASGVPVIASDVAGTRGQVPDAWRFPVGDAKALAARIDRVVRGTLGDGVRPVLTAEEVVARTVEVYRSAGAEA